MSYPSIDDNPSYAIFVPLVIGPLFGIVILGWITDLVSELASVDESTVVAWEMGIAGMVLAVWMILKMPLVRFSVIVTGTAIGLIVLVLCWTGRDEQVLDSVVTKTSITLVSVGMGAVYMYWEIKRHPDEWP